MTPYATSGDRSAPPAVGAGSRDGEPRVVLLLFAAARVAAGTGRDEMTGRDLSAVLEEARGRHGPDFAAVLDGSRVWVNGEPAAPDLLLAPGDEVAVLPPVSGGSLGRDR